MATEPHTPPPPPTPQTPVAAAPLGQRILGPAEAPPRGRPDAGAATRPKRRRQRQAQHRGLSSDPDKTLERLMRRHLHTVMSTLEGLLREAELEPVAWSRALFGPPFQWAAPWAESVEMVGD